MGMEGKQALSEQEWEHMMDLQAMKDEPLHPDLEPWVEEGTWGPMLRHPLVYSIPLFLPGEANRTYLKKREAVAEATAEGKWHTVIWLHERPYRLKALIDYVTGCDEEGNPLPMEDEHSDLVADVWIDSENINQNLGEWRDLLLNGQVKGGWLGTDEERAEFDALPDPIPAYRGGTVGDWSWTTDIKIAEFFANRSGIPPRHAMIPKSDCFGYFTRRDESELLVRLTDERRLLVYPEGEPVSGNEEE